jgi:hypothetical protein
MAVKVNVGFSRKIGEAHYGSRGASVYVELELDRLAIDDSERFRSEIERIFEQARDAVDRELQQADLPEWEPRGHLDERPNSSGQNGRAGVPRLATPNQVRAIQTIARHRGVDLRQLLDVEFNAKMTEELTIVEASLLIDRLKLYPIPRESTRPQTAEA